MRFPNGLLAAVSGGLALLALPLILRKVPPNPVYGFRTPSTMSDEALWYRANAFAGWAILLASLLSLLLLTAGASWLWGEPLGPVAALALPQAGALLACLAYLRLRG